MVTTKSKSIVDTVMIMRKNLSIPLKKVLKPQRKRASEEVRNREEL